MVPEIERVWAHPHSNDRPGRIHYLIDGRHLYTDPGTALWEVLSVYAKQLTYVGWKHEDEDCERCEGTGYEQTGHNSEAPCRKAEPHPLVRL